MLEIIRQVERMKSLEEDTESVDTGHTTLSDTSQDDVFDPFTVLPTVLEEGRKIEETIMLSPLQIRLVNFKIWWRKYRIKY